MIDLTPIFQAIIALLAALITYKLIQWIISKTTAQQQANLVALAKTAVYAAEQLYGAGQGDKKLEYVRNILLAAGFNVDTDLLRAAIENAVYNLPVWGEPLSTSQLITLDDLPFETADKQEAPAVENNDEPAPTADAHPEGDAEKEADAEDHPAHELKPPENID